MMNPGKKDKLQYNSISVYVEDGDKIHIDIPNRSLTLLVDDAVIEERKKKGILPPKELDGYLKRYAKMVTSSNTGAVFED